MASPQTPARRLSSRRGSMAAPDPFLQYEVPAAVSSSSRITIVRVPGTMKDPTPPSPGTHPRESFSRSSDRDPGTSARRSSWGSAKSGASDGSGGGGGVGRGRLSFAFASFTPINPPDSRHERYGSSGAAGSGPPSPIALKHTRRSFGNANATSMSPPRAASLTPQQLYEVAHQATNPTAPSTSSPTYGYGGIPIPSTTVQSSGGIQPAPFVPLPSEVYLPFIQRPQEVSQLLATPQTGRLFALLASTFPQESAGAAISRPSSSMSIRPQHTGGSSASVPPVNVFSEIPDDPKTWTFSQLNAWMRYITRQEANDREWVRKIRLCINTRSEVLWQRMAGALGVPPGFEEEDSALADDDEYSGTDARYIDIGRTQHSALASKFSKELSESVDSPATDDPEATLATTVALNTEEDLFDEEELELSSQPESMAIIEPITASSLPPPPSISGLSSSSGGLGLTSGDPHSLSDLREEEEETEESDPSPSAGAPLDIKNSSLGAPPQHGHEYVPRNSSPLVASTLAGDDHDTTMKGKPSLHVATPTTGSDPQIHVQRSDTVDEPIDGEIDFGEPDPNAEAIQGLRIMNSPMVSFSPGSMVVSDEGDVYYGANLAESIPQQHHSSSAAQVPSGPKPRSDSLGSGVGRFSASARVHQRTQSFGAYHSRRSSLPHGHLGAAGLTGNAERGPGNPLFPSSFAGLSIAPTLSINNPRLRRPSNPNPPASAYPSIGVSGRHAGIPLGTGMHHTPRASGPLQPSNWRDRVPEDAITLRSESSDRG